MTSLLKCQFMVKKFLIFLIKSYRFLLSPWLGSHCRFEPSCSQYALLAVEKHGSTKGVVLTAGRLLRCHPWCQGGHDPVPEFFNFSALKPFSKSVRPQDQVEVKSVSDAFSVSSSTTKN